MFESPVEPLLPSVPRRPTVLVADDEAPLRAFLRRTLTIEGYVVEETSDGPSALSAVAALSPDLVIIDIELPGLNAFDVCRRVRQDAATRLTPIIVITAVGNRAERVEGLDAGADDLLTKPVDALELVTRVRSLVRMKLYTDDLDSASSIITTLASMIEARDGYGTGHCHRMANYATSLGRALRISEADQQALYRGGFLHDIGMLAIPDALLNKTAPLDTAEFEQIKSHTVVGDSLVANLRSLQPVRPIIRWHHERLDGSGYPDGLQADQIPMLAQIVGVVDVFEAMTTERPYRPAHSREEALDQLRADVRRGWRRRDIVEAFASLIQSRPHSV